MCSATSWDGTGLRTTSLSFYHLVISLCISLLLTPPFWKHLMRQTKGRVNGKIISCLFTDILPQQLREPEIRALCLSGGNGMEDYAKDTLVLYFLMCPCLIFTGFVLVSSHHLLQLDHASQEYSIMVTGHFNGHFWLVCQFWHLFQSHVQIPVWSYTDLKNQLLSSAYTHTPTMLIYV